MTKLRQALQLALGTDMSNRAIGRELGIAFNSVRRYRITARLNGYKLPELLELDDHELCRCFNKLPSRREEKRLPDWNHIHSELQRRHMTLQLLWEEYGRDEPDTAYRYSQFTHLYREWAKRAGLSMRQHHAPGERGWVDFLGPTMQWVDAKSGEAHKVQVFVGALGVSHLLFALAVPAQTTEWWIHAHNCWYEFLGGVPKITVPDNLKAGVLRAGYDAKINPTYLEMGRHFGTVILPARSRKPKDKAKVEGGVLIIERWALARLRDRVFHSLAELNAALRDCVALINERKMRVFNASRLERFAEIDRPALLDLPVQAFVFGEWLPAVRIASDYHVPVDGHHYSVPFQLVREVVNIRLTASLVEIFHRRERVASHLRSHTPGGITTDPAHQPPTHRAWADQSPERYREWAITIGPKALLVIEHQLSTAVHVALAMKACSGLKGLARTYGAERFEAACSEAIRFKSPTRKSIRSLLQNRLERGRETRTKDSGAPVPQHMNVRGPEYYRSEDENHAS